MAMHEQLRLLGALQYWEQHGQLATVQKELARVEQHYHSRCDGQGIHPTHSRRGAATAAAAHIVSVTAVQNAKVQSEGCRFAKRGQPGSI